MGTLILSIAEVRVEERERAVMRKAFARSKRWEALLKRKPLYPAFLKACRKAEGTIPTLEEFNQLWPPEREKVVYVDVRTAQEARYMADWITRQSTDPPSSEAPQ